MQLQDFGAPVDVREVDDDLPVEATGAQQCVVEDVGTVRRRHHDDPALGTEPVELHEHLVERLLALVVALAHARSALATDRIELVDEDDGRRCSARLAEQIAHTRSADAHQRLHELRAG